MGRFSHNTGKFLLIKRDAPTQLGCREIPYLNRPTVQSYFKEVFNPSVGKAIML